MMEIENAFDFVELGLVLTALIVAGVFLITEKVKNVKEKRKDKKTGKKKR